MAVSPDSRSPARRSVRAYLGPAVGAAMVLALLVGISALVHSRLSVRQMVTLLQTLQGRGWAIPAYLLLYLVASALFAPVALFHVAAGVTWGFQTAIVLNLLACNVSATLQFLLARKLGKHRVDDWVHQKHWELLEARLAQGGFRAIVAIRLLPLPTMAVNLGAGVSTIRWRDFALGSLVGTLPVTVVYTYSAAALAGGATGAERVVLLRMAIAGALLLAVVFGPKLIARLLRRLRA